MKIEDFHKYPEMRRVFYRLAAEYGKGDGETRTGNPKRLLNRAIRLELLGGDCVLDLVNDLVNIINDPKTPEGLVEFVRDVLDDLKKAREEMAEEIIRRYKNPPGEKILIELYQRMEALLDPRPIDGEELIKKIRDDVYETIQDMVS